MNSEESLHFIEKMIRTAQEKVEDSSFYFLLWGWSVFIASMMQFYLLQINYEYNFIGWVILMPLSGIITFIYSAREDKNKPKVKTYVNDIMQYVMISFVVTLFIVLFFQSKLQLNTYPMVLLIYGVWLFVSGGALKFKPLIAGGIINWALAVVSFFQPFNIQLLLLAIAVLLGYIIPGHILKSHYKKTAIAGI